MEEQSAYNRVNCHFALVGAMNKYLNAQQTCKGNYKLAGPAV